MCLYSLPSGAGASSTDELYVVAPAPLAAPVLCAAADLGLRSAWLPDAAMGLRRALRAAPHSFDGGCAAVVLGPRVGGFSGLTLAGVLRDGGMRRPIVLLSAGCDPILRARAERLRLTLVPGAVGTERLRDALSRLLPCPS